MTKISQNDFQREIVAALPSLWRFSMSLCGAADVADDLTQKTCLRALERRDQVYDTAGIGRWLLTICRSIWYNELRANALRKAQSLESTEARNAAAENPSSESNIFTGEVFTAVMNLPEAQRSVVMVVLIEGFAYREAAEMLDIPIGTVMSRLSAAREKLRMKLDSDVTVAREEVK